MLQVKGRLHDTCKMPRSEQITRWLWSAVAIWSSVGNVYAASTSSSSLVLGLGPGLVAVIVLAVVCVAVCIVGYSAQQKTCFLIPVVVIVGGTTLFFATVRVDSPTSAVKATQYNQVAVARSAVAAIMITFTVISCFSMLLMHVLKPRQGQLLGDTIARRDGYARVF